MENHYFKSTFKVKLAKIVRSTYNWKSEEIVTSKPFEAEISKNHYFKWEI